MLGCRLGDKLVTRETIGFSKAICSPADLKEILNELTEHEKNNLLMTAMRSIKIFSSAEYFYLKLQLEEIIRALAISSTTGLKTLCTFSVFKMQTSGNQGVTIQQLPSDLQEVFLDVKCLRIALN